MSDKGERCSPHDPTLSPNASTPEILPGNATESPSREVAISLSPKTEARALREAMKHVE